MSVIPNSHGASAAVSVQNTEPPAFAPFSVKVKAGATVQFSPGTRHNVVFDIVSGAPQNIVSSLYAALRSFPVAGTFTYSCTVHGESGVVNVTALS